MRDPNDESIDLRTPLSLRTSFAFPLQSLEARRDVIVGGLLLLLPGIGWLLNLGHRIVVVHRLLHDERPWPAWSGWRRLFRHGCVAFLGMIYYYLPSVVLGFFAWRRASLALAAASGLAFVLATLAIPGFMTHYCVAFDPQEIVHPARALRRAIESGQAYWKAWGIALGALGLSFLGLLGGGVGFLLPVSGSGKWPASASLPPSRSSIGSGGDSRSGFRDPSD
jgi:hypothetical protein